MACFVFAYQRMVATSLALNHGLPFAMMHATALLLKLNFIISVMYKLVYVVYL